MDVSALVLNHSEWPAGVIGIVASRLAEMYHRPVFLISSPPEGAARGSARSYGGIDVTASLKGVRDLLKGFGGHKMAAGFSLASENISRFRRELSAQIKSDYPGGPANEPLIIDFDKDFAEITPDFVDQLEKLGPFGPGNPSINFAAHNLILKNQRYLGKTKEHLQLVVENESGELKKFIWWQGAGFPLPEGKFDLAYQVRQGSFLGKKEIQFEWVNARNAYEVIDLSASGPGKDLNLEDWRNREASLVDLRNLSKLAGVLIFAEGVIPAGIPSVNRNLLTACRTLVVWSAPPGPRILTDLIEQCRPEKIILFAENNSLDDLKKFKNHLVGLVNYSMNKKDGIFEVARAAAAMGQKETAVKIGINILESYGYLNKVNLDTNGFLLARGKINEINFGGNNPLERQLLLILNETKAYRNYLKTVEIGQLIESLRK